MQTSIHVVHPYVYKIEEFLPGLCRLGTGPSKIYASRDEKVSRFVKAGLDKGVRVVVHHMATLDNECIDHVVALVSDPNYRVLVTDERILVNTIATTDKGMTIPDERPEQIKPENWALLQRIFSSDRALKAVSGKSDRTFFIGGAVEACLAGAIDFYDQLCRQPGEQVYCVKDLCVSHDLDAGAVVAEELRKRNVSFIDSPEAFRLLAE